MPGSQQQVMAALSHQQPDRTPLFEIFQPYHPIHWDICGHTVATDMTLAWDAMTDGMAWEELVEAEIKAEYTIRKFFGLDMVRLNGAPPPNYQRPIKVARTRWMLNRVPYHLNERTQLVELENPAEDMSDTHKISEDKVRREIENWDGSVLGIAHKVNPVLAGVKQLAERDGIDWTYMGEIGAGTGVAFYPPFMLMWLIEEPALLQRWLDMQKASAFAGTRKLIEEGCRVIAMGGDVSCDKGPFISPAHYHEFILPVIQEHVQLIHSLGAKAVYTSDGNHWPIKEDFFFNSGIDGYKEVDKAAGMTWPRLIEAGVADRICIIGNIDARHTLCLGSPQEVRKEVIACLRYGQQNRGGHILHASHSVHEDVKAENYYALVAAYREYFGLPTLPAGQPPE